MCPIGSSIISKTVYHTSAAILQYCVFRGWGLPRQVDIVPAHRSLKIGRYWTWEMDIGDHNVGFQRHGAVGFHAFHIIGMDSISDIIVDIARGMQIVGNQIAVSIDPVMGSIADAAPGDGDVSAVCCSLDIGRRIDIGCFGITVENSRIACVVSPVV